MFPFIASELHHAYFLKSVSNFNELNSRIHVREIINAFSVQMIMFHLNIKCCLKTFKANLNIEEVQEHSFKEQIKKMLNALLKIFKTVCINVHKHVSMSICNSFY